MAASVLPGMDSTNILYSRRGCWGPPRPGGWLRGNNVRCRGTISPLFLLLFFTSFCFFLSFSPFNFLSFFFIYFFSFLLFSFLLSVCLSFPVFSSASFFLPFLFFSSLLLSVLLCIFFFFISYIYFFSSFLSLFFPFLFYRVVSLVHLLLYPHNTQSINIFCITIVLKGHDKMHLLHIFLLT